MNKGKLEIQDIAIKSTKRINKKLNIENLVIETTRRCNMSCSHCLRGDAENVNIDIKHVNKLFSNLESIGTLTITGGEPSLYPEMIDQIVDSAKRYNIPVNNFYLVTNAKKVTAEFLKAIIGLYAYCECDDEIAGLSISDDGYHDELNKVNVRMLEAFKFTNVRGSNGGYYEDDLINEGRAIDNHYTTRELKLSEFEIYNNSIGDGDIYLNCLGDVLPACDLSYDSQGNNNLILGNVHDKNFNLMKAIKRFNKRLDGGMKTIDELSEMKMVA